MAQVLTEWGKQKQFETGQIPNDDIICDLLQMYINECDRLVPGYSIKPTNSLSAHLKETKIMLLAVQMLFFALIMKQTDAIIPTLPFDRKKHTVTIYLGNKKLK